MLYPIELRVRFEVLEYGERSGRNQAINWIESNKLRVSIGDTAIPSFESISRSGISRSLMQEPCQNQGSPFRSLHEDSFFLSPTFRKPEISRFALREKLPIHLPFVFFARFVVKILDFFLPWRLGGFA